MENNNIYGIDLGTTYSCIAYVDEYGKPTVVPNSEGQLTTPSVVYFESADNIVVGESAKSEAEIHPNLVVSTVKQVMGDENFTFDHEGHSYTSQEVSSHILRKIVLDAEANTGHEIKDVVITVPAYFGSTQKEATKQAGEIAGLNVLYVIPEPTAAAISYGMEQQEDQIVMVYDLGGGTFDITVIEVKDSAITVVCTGGSHQLGGRDWDEVIASYLAQCFSDEIGTPVDELTEDKETWQELLNLAEKSKKDLSSKTMVTLPVRYDGDRVRVELSREKFDDITNHLLEKTLSKTESLVQTAKDKGYPQIDKILLVGGSSYMPQVQAALQTKFSSEIKLFDPNQSVAKGAALFGYKCFLDEQIKIAISEETGQTLELVDITNVSQDELSNAQTKVAKNHGMPLPGLKKLTDTDITNVTSKSFGIVVLNEDGEEKVNNLIVVDDKIPCEITREYSTHADDQSGVNLRCFESLERLGGERTYDIDPDQEIGSTELVFERSLPNGSPISVTFSLGADGLLSVYGKDLTTQREITAEFKTESILSKEELVNKKAHNLAIKISS